MSPERERRAPSCDPKMLPCEERGARQEAASAALTASLELAYDRKLKTLPRRAGAFKNAHRDLQEVVRELLLVRSHNLAMAESPSNSLKLLLFAEASLVLIALERFARIVVREADRKADVYNLLQVARKHGYLTVSDTDIKLVNDVRNALLHANYEQAAGQHDVESVAGFFGSRFAGTVEVLTVLLDRLMREIDLDTGLPNEPA